MVSLWNTRCVHGNEAQEEEEQQAEESWSHLRGEEEKR